MLKLQLLLAAYPRTLPFIKLEQMYLLEID